MVNWNAISRRDRRDDVVDTCLSCTSLLNVRPRRIVLLFVVPRDREKWSWCVRARVAFHSDDACNHFLLLQSPGHGVVFLLNFPFRWPAKRWTHRPRRAISESECKWFIRPRCLSIQRDLSMELGTVWFSSLND